MGKLYDAVQVVSDMIESRGLDDFKTKGLISMKAGFFLSIITPETEDDAAKLSALRSAASEVIGVPVQF